MTTVGSKYRGTKEFLLIYSKLITAASFRGFVSYTNVARILGTDSPGHHMARQVGQVLGEISEDEHRVGRPMLSAVAVSTSGYPGEGFFKLAHDLGRLFSTNKDGEHDFWISERG
ncbi:MAG: hypothetical protein ACFFCW_23415 [Candidatus Hodarchaeota archaeon]